RGHAPPATGRACGRIGAATGGGLKKALGGAPESLRLAARARLPSYEQWPRSSGPGRPGSVRVRWASAAPRWVAHVPERGLRFRRQQLVVAEQIAVLPRQPIEPLFHLAKT